MMIHNLNLFHLFYLNENIRLSPLLLSVEQTFFIGHEIRQPFKPLSSESKIDFTQDIEINFKAIKDTLNFKETFSFLRTKEYSISHLLSFSSHVARNYTFSVLDIIDFVEGQPNLDNLIFIEDISYSISKEFFNQIEFIETLNLKLDRVFSIVDTLSFGSYPTYLDTTSKCESVTLQNKIKLIFGSRILELRNPELEDVYTYEEQRILRRSRGNDLVVFRDNTWPKMKTLSYTIRSLTQDEAKNFLSFVEESFGQLITLQDYEGVEWEGILNTSGEVVEEGPNCQFSTSFVLEV